MGKNPWESLKFEKTVKTLGSPCQDRSRSAAYLIACSAERCTVSSWLHWLSWLPAASCYHQPNVHRVYSLRYV